MRTGSGLGATESTEAGRERLGGGKGERKREGAGDRGGEAVRGRT